MERAEKKITVKDLLEALSKGAVYGAHIEAEEPYVTLDGTFDLEVIAREIVAQVSAT